jgi:hypothetical protein
MSRHWCCRFQSKSAAGVARTKRVPSRSAPTPLLPLALQEGTLPLQAPAVATQAPVLPHGAVAGEAIETGLVAQARLTARTAWGE